MHSTLHLLGYAVHVLVWSRVQIICTFITINEYLEWDTDLVNDCWVTADHNTQLHPHPLCHMLAAANSLAATVSSWQLH